MKKNPGAPTRIRIVSGGQTGVDRAALDAALMHRLDCGGWCPCGRRAEDGRINASYPLRETPSTEYDQRTAWNVRDSDATLILSPIPLADGTAKTAVEARVQHRPLMALDPAEDKAAARIEQWIRSQRFETLNVAGPRESQCPGIYDSALGLLSDLLVRLMADEPPT